MNESIGDSHVVRCVSDLFNSDVSFPASECQKEEEEGYPYINQSIVVVLVVISIGGDITVVNPDIV